jgi:hypothetical protein
MLTLTLMSSGASGSNQSGCRGERVDGSQSPPSGAGALITPSTKTVFFMAFRSATST